MAKIIISLPDELLQAVDKYCIDFQYNRSEFIRFLMRQELESSEYVTEVANRELKNDA